MNLFKHFLKEGIVKINHGPAKDDNGLRNIQVIFNGKEIVNEEYEFTEEELLGVAKAVTIINSSVNESLIKMKRIKSYD